MSVWADRLARALVVCALVMTSCGREPVSDRDDPPDLVADLLVAPGPQVVPLADHGFVQTHRGFQVDNPAHQLRAELSDGGVRLRADGQDWSWGFRLSEVGRAGSMVPIPRVEPTAVIDADGVVRRVTLHRPMLEEWYVNGIRGIEQGFDLLRPPGGDGELVLRAVIDGADAVLTDPTTLELSGDGVPLMSYSDLLVLDAAGQRLPARMTQDDDGLALRVEDAAARYPITVDPLIAECPGSWCSDGDVATIDMCSHDASCDPGTEDCFRACAHYFDEAFDGVECSWGQFCCADNQFHGDCSDPSIPTTQDCPDDWCSDGDLATIDVCALYSQSTGTFACSNSFDDAQEGDACNGGPHCCEDGQIHADCDAVAAPPEDGGGGDEPAPGPTDCPDAWCSDGDSSTDDLCSDLIAPGQFTCTFVLRADLVGTACEWGEFCCADGIYHLDCETADIPASQPCPDDWCSDGDVSSVDHCDGQTAPGEFTCSYTFEETLDGLPCTWGLYCCDDDTFRADCAIVPPPEPPVEEPPAEEPPAEEPPGEEPPAEEPPAEEPPVEEPPAEEPPAEEPPAAPGGFTPPAAPPALEPLSAEEVSRDVARFLNQASFGATPASHQALMAMVAAHDGDRIAAMSAWIDAQMDTLVTPSASHESWTRANHALWDQDRFDRRHAWYGIARYSRDELRQRMALALSELVVVSENNAGLGAAPYGIANYQDMLAANAFGSYRKLLGSVSRHPAMGWYLSHIRNSKEIIRDGVMLASPDENYARELMQLFTIGLVELDPDGTVAVGADGEPVETYDNSHVTELARVFTGFGFGTDYVDGEVTENLLFGRNVGSRDPTQTAWVTTMKMFDAFHDSGEKVLVGGHVMPAGQDGLTDVNQALDLLLAHPNTAPFVSRQLIQRFVTSNPSPGYVYRVAQVFSSSGGDLGAVVPAILLDYEARSLDHADDPTFGKLREPVLRLIHLLRLTDAGSDVPLSAMSAYGLPGDEQNRVPHGASLIRMRTHGVTRQVPQAADTVFNFFRPDHRPAGPIGDQGLVAPEFQITTELLMYEYINVVWDLLLSPDGIASRDTFPTGASLRVVTHSGALDAVHDAAAISGGAAAAAEAAVDWIDLFLTGGTLADRYVGAAEPNPRSVLIQGLVPMPDKYRAHNALYLVAISAQGGVQR